MKGLRRRAENGSSAVVEVAVAVATGPFITTSNDILGVMIFFTMAIALYLV